MTIFIGFWLIGAVAFHAIEGWSYFNSVYFCFLCLLTIGYGDFAPKTALGRVFFVSWAIGAVPLMTILVSNFGDKLYAASNGVSHAFSKWCYEEDPEYMKKKSKRKEMEEAQWGDSSSSIDASSTSQMVREEEAQEDLEMGSLESELDEQELEDHPESPTTAKTFAMDEFVHRDGTISRIEEKKMMHENILEYLDKLKPFIADSIENSSKKYTHSQWNDLLLTLNDNRLDPSSEEFKLPKDGFWLGDKSPLRLPLKEPNYFILRVYFKIESTLRKIVEREIQDLDHLKGNIEQEEGNSNSTARSSPKVTFST
ncbi:Outward-rectifier potassium channel TOK1 [Spathaspora sp. JA1]|nr:Outward-rectifier potassium channel TOK1 [Spathaspora sp. JA1]